MGGNVTGCVSEISYIFKYTVAIHCEPYIERVRHDQNITVESIEATASGTERRTNKRISMETV